MNTANLFALRELIDTKIDAQLSPGDREMAKAITGIVMGIAIDFGRIADALEVLASPPREGL